MPLSITELARAEGDILFELYLDTLKKMLGSTIAAFLAVLAVTSIDGM